jgi:hypothetical protein
LQSLSAYGILIDICYFRGEKCGKASTSRKNLNRRVSDPGRMKMGVRGDVAVMSNNVEYACSEVGLKEELYSSKMLSDGNLKIPKLLRDMLWTLCQAVEFDEEVMKKLQVVGYVIGGKIKKKHNIHVIVSKYTYLLFT